MDHIQLRGLRAVGTHGVLPEERQRAQPFEVDIDIEADLTEAGRSDDLADTVDYGAIALLVAAEVEGRHADLLEHLADRIACAVLAVAGGRATAVSVTLRKLRPPLPVDLSSVSVSVTRP
jgi:dihydroneopterin aldolase/2-amino-4-hydroxy-6-hydroxymethyldihydropteridine diphosphokinase